MSKVQLVCRVAFLFWSGTAIDGWGAEPLSEAEVPVNASSAQIWFQFDKADETVEATLLENPLAYEAGIASGKEGLWLTWLEFEPGKGDHLWMGLRGKDGWIERKQLLSTIAGEYANPTPTFDAEGNLWLSFERAETNGDWNVFAFEAVDSKVPWRRHGNWNIGSLRRLTEAAGANISHRAAPDAPNGIRLVWQGDIGGSFHIRSDRANKTEFHTFEENIGINGGAPACTVTPDGSLHVVWDAYAGGSYDVFEQNFGGNGTSQEAGSILSIATSANFEAHAQIASGKDGRLWVLWEEDGENWGKRYTARTPGIRTSTKMTDKVGPLHRFRRLHLAQLDEKEKKLTEYEIPQPSFELARARTNAPADLKDFGAFYERGQLVVDGQNRPWIVYRHFYVPWIGVMIATHKQENMRVYARGLLPGGWSKLYSFAEGQGDGGQRISVAPEPDGIALAWTVGRTDRRKTKDKHGVAFAEIKLTDAKASLPAHARSRTVDSTKVAASNHAHERPAAEVGGKRFELFYGDLHRHTDISLCFSPVDGTIDDAYRYAIDVAPLDFLGITDHTHDLEMGERLAHIWWRSRKEVNRHALGSTFIPFYSYERSRGDTDHNVISLRDDMLRPHTYPLPEFWKELDTNTFTIPHQPFNRVLWKHKDDVHRPLLEIYQGMRNNIEEADAQEGLRGGHHFGIIASSDHLSTDASFACVWSDKATREGIFRSMQARRTFGATAQIVLKVTAGEHWMGESFSTKGMPPIHIEVRGTAPIRQVDVLMDGKVQKSFQGQGENLVYESDVTLAGNHIFFVRLEQTDGNHAWSSPLWVNVNP